MWCVFLKNQFNQCSLIYVHRILGNTDSQQDSLLAHRFIKEIPNGVRVVEVSSRTCNEQAHVHPCRVHTHTA